MGHNCPVDGNYSEGSDAVDHERRVNHPASFR